jgi:hypothetical protein
LATPRRLPSAPRREDRIFITGSTGTGKTVLARALFAARLPPRLVIDPKGDHPATGGAYADGRQSITFSDPARIPDAGSLRFVPRDPFDLDLYHRLAVALWDRPGLYLWLDEAGLVLPAQNAPRAMLRLVTQGRARHIGIIGLHQRPVEVSRAFLGNAEHLAAFRLGHPDDVDTLAAHFGRPRAELADVLQTLASHGFAWYSRRDDLLARCAPLRL